MTFLGAPHRAGEARLSNEHAWPLARVKHDARRAAGVARDRFRRHNAGLHAAAAVRRRLPAGCDADANTLSRALCSHAHDVLLAAATRPAARSRASLTRRAHAGMLYGGPAVVVRALFRASSTGSIPTCDPAHLLSSALTPLRAAALKGVRIFRRVRAAAGLRRRELAGAPDATPTRFDCALASTSAASCELSIRPDSLAPGAPRDFSLCDAHGAVDGGDQLSVRDGRRTCACTAPACCGSRVVGRSTDAACTPRAQYYCPCPARVMLLLCGADLFMPAQGLARSQEGWASCRRSSSAG